MEKKNRTISLFVVLPLAHLNSKWYLVKGKPIFVVIC